MSGETTQLAEKVPRKTHPGRQIIEYGVVLDDQDSIDTYATYDEAAEAFRRHGGVALVHVVTTIAAYVLPDPLTFADLVTRPTPDGGDES